MLQLREKHEVQPFPVQNQWKLPDYDMYFKNLKLVLFKKLYFTDVLQNIFVKLHAKTHN